MKIVFGCLMIVGLISGIPSAVAEDDGSDLFVPAWEIPADALEPQNVRKSVDSVIPPPSVHPDERGQTGRKKASDLFTFGGFKSGTESKSSAVKGKQESTGTIAAFPFLREFSSPADDMFKSLRSFPLLPRDRWTSWEDDTADFNRQTAAVVNGGRIPNGEVLDRCSGWLISVREDLQRRGQPRSEFNTIRELQIQHNLPEYIQRRLFLDAMEAKLTGQQLMQLQAHMGGLIEPEIEKLMVDLKVRTREELDFEVTRKGTTLQNVKRSFVAEKLSYAYARTEADNRPAVTAQELSDFYQSHLANYAVPAKVEWEQIQISFDDPTSGEMARERLREAQGELDSATPVADVARRYSDGPTALEGGKWAWMSEGSLKDKKLERLLFEMPIGEWSKIYESGKAMQLVRVLGRRAAGHQPFNEVEDEISQRLETKRARTRLAERIQTLFDEATIESRYDVRWLNSELRWSVNYKSEPDRPADATRSERGPCLNREVFLKLNAEWRPADEHVRKDQMEFPVAVTGEEGDWLKLGRIWVRARDVMRTPEALDYFSDQIDLNPADPQCWIGRGTVWFRKGYIAAAVADYAEAIRLNPNQAKPYCLRGITSSQQDKNDAALNDFAEAIRVEPQSAMGYALRGGLLSRLNEPDAALKDLTEAIRLDSHFSIAFFLLAQIEAERNEVDFAIRDFTEVIRLDPTMAATASINRGVLQERKGDLDAAMSDYTQAVHLDPKMAVAYNNRAIVNNKKGDSEAAIRDYSEAIRLDPTFSRYFNGRGITWERQGDFAAAIKDYSEAIRINPATSDYYLNRASAGDKSGDFAAAIRDYTEAIRLQPKYDSAYESLAWLLATCADEKFRDGKRAVELATTACEISNWKGWDQIDTLAAAHAEMGDWQHAVQRQEQAVELADGEKSRQDAKMRLELYKTKTRSLEKSREIGQPAIGPILMIDAQLSTNGKIDFLGTGKFVAPIDLKPNNQ